MELNFLNSTTHSVAWLFKRYVAEELQLKAPFQRNPVWSDKQKSYLIDTILRGYPIPELYMQEFSDSSGNDVYTVVDGQQRVRSCIDFINGRFPISGKDSPEWADMWFEELSPNDKKKIYNYNFVVRIMPDVPDTELRAIFTRLNRHVVALNKQELRHATYWGEFITCVEAISNDIDWLLANIFTSNDVRRMIDIEFISELAVGYLHGLQNKKDSLDKWYQAYEEEFPDKDRLAKAFSMTLSEILLSVNSFPATRWRKKSDFYSLFLTMAEHSDKFPLSRDTRIELGKVLTEFGEAVDASLRNPDKQSDQNVKLYSEAVERAASDLSRRKARREQLLALIGPILARG